MSFFFFKSIQWKSNGFQCYVGPHWLLWTKTEFSFLGELQYTFNNSQTVLFEIFENILNTFIFIMAAILDYIHCKKTVILWKTIIILKNDLIYFCDAKLNFQHHYSSLQCHMILQNSFHSNMLICCSRNISDCYHCWK